LPPGLPGPRQVDAFGAGLLQVAQVEPGDGVEHRPDLRVEAAWQQGMVRRSAVQP
jgi:hypothetical protein